MNDLQYLDLLNKGIVAKRASNFSLAISCYESAMGLSPADDRAYKNIAKVFIGTGRYTEAIKALLTKVNLGVYYTLQSQDCGIIENGIRERQLQIESSCYHGNVVNAFSDSIKIGNFVSSTNYVSLLMSQSQKAFDVAKLMWAEDDIYFYIGHCFVRLFPDLFRSYGIPLNQLEALESALLGKNTGLQDLRGSQKLAPVFYITGFLVIMLNAPESYRNVTLDKLLQSYKTFPLLDFSTYLNETTHNNTSNPFDGIDDDLDDNNDNVDLIQGRPVVYDDDLDDNNDNVDFDPVGPFGEEIVASWHDDIGETWYKNAFGDCYTEEMGPPENWPDHD